MAKFIRVSEAYSTVINYIATLDEEYDEKTIDVLRQVAKSLCNLPSVTINEPSMQEVAYKMACGVELNSKEKIIATEVEGLFLNFEQED